MTLPRLVCSVVVNSDSLTINYGIKQNQFTKPTSKPRASDPEESNVAFDRAIRRWLLQYHCSKSSINYCHQIRRKKLHSSLKIFYKQTSFNSSYGKDSLLALRFQRQPKQDAVPPNPAASAQGGARVGRGSGPGSCLQDLPGPGLPFFLGNERVYIATRQESARRRARGWGWTGVALLFAMSEYLFLLRSCIGLSVNAWMCMCLLYVLRSACGCMRWLHGVCHLFQESKSYATADFKYNNIYSLGIEQADCLVPDAVLVEQVGIYMVLFSVDNLVDPYEVVEPSFM